VGEHRLRERLGNLHGAGVAGAGMVQDSS
jgi:hypothetical protein